MFQTNQGPSFPAHQFLFGASSAPTGPDDHNGIFTSGNAPIGTHNGGCASATTTKAPLINPEGVEFGETFPCFDRWTLADLLDAQKVVALLWRDPVRRRDLDGAECDQAHLCRRRPELHRQPVDQGR